MSPAVRARKANRLTSSTQGRPPGFAGDSGDIMDGLLQQQWKRYRRALKRCQDKFTLNAIHEFRVETRRLLSCLALLEDLLPARRVGKVWRLLKRRLDLLDDLRDTQVQLETLVKLHRASTVAGPFRASLRKREQRFTRRTRKQIRKVKARRLGKLVAECQEYLETAIAGAGSRKALAALLRSVGRAFRRACHLHARINPRDSATIHRTRVAFKRFRYMVEALAACLPAVTRQRLGAMRRYQTMMGNIQDAEVLLGALDGFLARQAVNPETVRRFREQLLRRRQRLIRVYLRASGQLLKFWPLPLSCAAPAAAYPQPAAKANSR